MEGLIPFISTSFQAIAFLCFFKSLINFSFSTLFNLDEIITGELPSLSRKAYSKPFGSSLSSRGGSLGDSLFWGSSRSRTLKVCSMATSSSTKWSIFSFISDGSSSSSIRGSLLPKGYFIERSRSMLLLNAPN
ncbi:hypothetical protein HanRHA438_Chr05g0230741 [Helianthus annuus]|nr:hypothetical protein HanRHA438_Chr05g0230741 [Helianthus annuus]